MQHKTLSRGLYPGGGGEAYNQTYKKAFQNELHSSVDQIPLWIYSLFLVPKRLKKVEFILIQARVGLMTECILFVYR